MEDATLVPVVVADMSPVDLNTGWDVSHTVDGGVFASACAAVWWVDVTIEPGDVWSRLEIMWTDSCAVEA